MPYLEILFFANALAMPCMRIAQYNCLHHPLRV